MVRFLALHHSANRPENGGENCLLHCHFDNPQLEGGPWQFLTVTRYNSWQDFATNQKASAADTLKPGGGWLQVRDTPATTTTPSQIASPPSFSRCGTTTKAWPLGWAFFFCFSGTVLLGALRRKN